MQRIVVVGNAGSGKSMLSNLLGELLGIDVIRPDQIIWQSGWWAIAPDEFARIHTELVQRPRWIINGVATWESVRERVEAAATIIFRDYALWLVYWWAAKRQVASIFTPRLPTRLPPAPDA